MHPSRGFTLIELSIVLVIIGLIVGGILVGQDLIKAAETRAQISQIEKYNSAVNTFRGKFGGLPGDLALASANQYGLPTDASCNGGVSQRDGNGLIDGATAANILAQTKNETAYFWQDITSSAAGSLIEGQFPSGGAPAIVCNNAVAVSTTAGTTFVGDYFPAGKIGHGTYVYVYETSGYNWYGLSAITSTTLGGGTGGMLFSSATIPVVQAYNIDKKMDDGLPTTGAVQAVYLNNNNLTPQNSSSAATDSTTTCFNTTGNAYSVSSLANYGASGNCALSFRFQ